MTQTSIPALPASPPTCEGSPAELRVVVVEHHDALRDVLAHALMAATHEPVRTASCWREFAGVVEAGSTDVVVLDLDLPTDGGLQACRQARALHPGAHLIAMSASAESRDAAAALNAGADQLLAKPVSTVEILAHINRWQARRAAAA